MIWAFLNFIGNTFIYLFIYLIYFWLRWVFVAVRGLSFFLSCSEQGILFIAMRGPLIVVASLVLEHRL